MKSNHLGGHAYQRFGAPYQCAASRRSFLQGRLGCVIGNRERVGCRMMDQVGAAVVLVPACAASAGAAVMALRPCQDLLEHDHATSGRTR